jgi:hypothetical protein
MLARPQYAATLLPLASGLLENCTAVAGDRGFRTGQMLYDIIFNLNPELLGIPFDKGRSGSRSLRELRAW